jgi:hypothetical protein
MIRKLLVIAAAVAMPASAAAAITTVGTAGVAGATNPVYTTQVCAITGSLAFASPGLSHLGVITSAKSSMTSATSTFTGTGCGAGSSTTYNDSLSITSANADCKKVSLSTYPGCAGQTKHAFYDQSAAAGFVSVGTASIAKSLKAGLALYYQGAAVTAEVKSTSVASLTGSACGESGANQDAGFQLSGKTSKKDLNYLLDLCIVTDTGSNISNWSLTDILGANGGGDQVITGGTFGQVPGYAASQLTFMQAPGT